MEQRPVANFKSPLQFKILLTSLVATETYLSSIYHGFVGKVVGSIPGRRGNGLQPWARFVAGFLFRMTS